MNNTLGFSPSLLDAFEKTGKPFIVYKGRLYTVEKPMERETRNKLHLWSEDYNVFPADTLMDIRNEQFSRHEEQLKNYMNWVVSFKILRRIDAISEKIEKTMDYYGKLRQDKVKGFMLDVFDQFNHVRDQAPKDIQPSTLLPETLFDLEELQGIPDVFSACFPGPGMVALGDRAYTMKPRWEQQSTLAANSLEIGRQAYLLEPHLPLKDIILEYDAKTRGCIESTALRQGRIFADHLSRIKDQQASLASLVQRHQQATNEKRHGDISYRQLDSDTYRITVDIPPFLFERRGNYYVFGTQGQNSSKHVRVGMDVTIDNKGVILHEEPSVQDKPYFHPFVFESGHICYKGNIGDPWKEKDIAFSKRYPHSTPGLARKVMLLLHEGRSSITNGLLGTHAKPVYDFDNFKPIARSESEARAYARSNNIDERRIFRN